MNDKESNFISVVLYFKENETNETQFLNMIYSVLEKNFKKYELICVSNYANAIATEKVKKFKKEHEDLNISFIHLDEKQGLEECMNAGIDLSIGDFIFEFDSCYIDYDKSIVMEVYRKSLEGYDIVAAVPPARQSRLSSKMFYKIYNYFSDMKDLTTERFRIISRRAVNRVSAYNKIVPYRKAVYASVGLETSYIRYTTIKDISGEVNSDTQKNKVALDSLILFTGIAYKLSFTLSILMAVFMLSTGLYTVIVYFSKHIPVEGWAPLMGLISAGFLAIFIIMTVVIKYMDLLLRLIFKKQKYMVVKIEKL